PECLCGRHAPVPTCASGSSATHARILTDTYRGPGIGQGAAERRESGRGRGVNQTEFHHIRNSCHSRLKKPASSTASSATSGRYATTLPSRVTRTLPMAWPLAIGASSVSGTSIDGLSWSYLPRGRLTSSGAATPSCTSLTAPFHTFCVDTGLDASYRRWVSWKRKPQLSRASESVARCASPVEPITTEINRWSPRLAEASRQ